MGGAWVTVPWSSLRLCSAVLYTLSPGQVAIEPLTLDSSYPSARYRVRTGVEWPIGHQVLVASTAFDITP